MENKNRRNQKRRYESYNSSSVAVDYRKQQVNTTRKPNSNQRRTSFIEERDKRRKTDSKYTKDNLKYDAKSIERRRRKLKVVEKREYYIENSSFAQKMQLLAEDKIKSKELIDGEEIILVGSDCTLPKLPFFFKVIITTCIIVTLAFVYISSLKTKSLEDYSKKIIVYNELKRERDNLKLELSEVNTNEEYKIIAKNKLGMDKPKSHQIVPVTIENVNYSEVYLRNEKKDSNWYAKILNYWRN